MFHSRGGMVVGKGTYWNLLNGERHVLKAEGTLPGTSQTQYLKVPAVVVVLIGPVIGLFYVVLLPFIGLAMILMLAVRQLVNMLSEALSVTAAFGWRPVEAYLMSRRQKKAGRAEKKEPSVETDDRS
jgi:hypothetical protein